jgi:putative permease
MQVLTNWFKRYFTDPQIVSLALFLLVGFAVVLTMGDMLAPVLASIVIAYLLEGLVGLLHGAGLPRFPAVVLVYLVFMLSVILLLFGMLPLLSRQVTDLVQQLPSMISQGQQALMRLPERYPELLSPEQIQQIFSYFRGEMGSFGQAVLSWSLASVAGFIALVVYLILMPLLVFFFLKDKVLILDWLKQFLPRHRIITDQVWHDVDRQIGNYVRGKFWEVVIVWVVSFVTFQFLGLNYALLLSVLVGLSVIIPYIGAVAVTFPVMVIAWFQWGWSGDLLWLAVAYLVIQILDGNILVPLMFSEVVNIHPVAIIVAVLVFGGLWGFWGVFFAIPLATLVHAVINAWPKDRVFPAHPQSGGVGEAVV